MKKNNIAPHVVLLLCLAFSHLSFNLPAVHGKNLSTDAEITRKSSAALPSLTGEKAIEYLKQSDEYQSLAAVASVQLEAYLKSSNSDAGDRFGSVAISGDTVVVGAFNESSAATGANGNQADNSLPGSGAVYVFVRNDNGWSQQAYLKASKPDISDGFGRVVAIDGDTIVVGVPTEDSNATGINSNQSDNSAQDSGAVYVFVRNGITWSQQAYLKASNTDSRDSFGYSIAISGNTIVVGALSEASNATGINGNQNDNSAPSAGAAYVFVRNGTAWTQQAYLKASNAEASDVFGGEVAISGDTIAVSAWGEDGNALGVNGNQSDNSAPSSGAAYVFVRNGTTWAQQAYVKPPVAQECTGGLFSRCPLFGIALELSGNTLAVVNIVPVTTHIYVRNGTDWSLQSSYLIGGIAPSAVMLSLSGERFALSLYDTTSLWIVKRNGTTWSEEARPSINPILSLALDGDTIVSGNSQEASDARGINGDPNNSNAPNSGAAYIYSIVPSTTPACDGLVQEAETPNAILTGFTVANDPAASGGSYIGAPAGGSYYNGPNPSLKAEYCFNVPTTGSYRIKAKSYAANDLSDSFYVTVDGQPTNGYLWDVAHNTSYATDYVNDRNNADPVELNLTAGQHTVTVYLREQGTRLDTIELELVPTQPNPTCAGLVQEAESGVISGNWTIGSDVAANGGAYIAAPNGSGDFWNGASSTQKASYCFNVTTAGSYRIRGKVYGADTLSDSFYVQVDGQPSTGYLWDIQPNTSYASDSVNDRGVADPVEMQLTAGQHTVNVFVREDGTRLDTIELQLVDSGPPPTPTCAGLTQEAETGALFGNFAIGNDAAASGGKYVSTSAGSGDFWNGPNAGHKAGYCFNVPTAGSYRIDGKVYGVAPLSDSFYVTVDGQPTTGYLWDILPNTTYAVDSVSDRNNADPVVVNLSAGQHTVAVYAREAGTRLDTIQLVASPSSATGRAMSPLAAGVGGTVRLDGVKLTSEIDFSTISLTLLDTETLGNEFSQTVTADRFGNYHFDGMMPGSYLVQIQTPSGLVAELVEATITATRDEPVTVNFAVSEAGGKTYLPLISR